MKREGFTLIELLAVIVILAVIALIATPLIMNVIEDSKKAAFKEQANSVIHASELALGAEAKLPTSFEIKNEGIIQEGTTKVTPLSKPIDGTGIMYFSETGKTAIKITNEKYCAYKTFEEDIVSVKNGDCGDIELIKWSDWLTEEELVNQGKDKNDSSLKTKTQYKLTYTKTTTVSGSGGSASSNVPSGIAWNQPVSRSGTYTFTKPVYNLNWSASFSMTDCGENGNSYTITGVTITGQTVTLYSSGNLGYSGGGQTKGHTSSGKYTANGLKSITMTTSCSVFSGGCSATVTSGAWENIETITGTTDWQDSNKTDLGTITNTETRIVYSYPIY